ncbi:hypothetical protein AB4345_05375 [Vibrio breoganii]
MTSSVSAFPSCDATVSEPDLEAIKLSKAVILRKAQAGYRADPDWIEQYVQHHVYDGPEPTLKPNYQKRDPAELERARQERLDKQHALTPAKQTPPVRRPRGEAKVYVPVKTIQAVTFTHPEHGSFTVTNEYRSESKARFLELSGIHKTNISPLIKGKVKSSKGWTVQSIEDIPT